MVRELGTYTFRVHNVRKTIINVTCFATSANNSTELLAYGTCKVAQYNSSRTARDHEIGRRLSDDLSGEHVNERC